MAIDFASTCADNPWLAALAWMKDVFTKQQRLSQRPLNECPEETIPKRSAALSADHSTKREADRSAALIATNFGFTAKSGSA